MRILVTRPEREGRATAARLAELGHVGVVEPLTAVVATPGVRLSADGVQAVAVTSLNAVEVLEGRPDLDGLLGLPLFAVGDRSARAAREAGFRDVRSAAGDRAALARAIAAALDPAAGRVLWLAGEDRAGDLAADLAPSGFGVETVAVYRAAPGATLSAATADEIAAGTIDAALAFSPRSGAILLAALRDRGFSPASLDFAIHAISEAAAQPFRDAGWRRVIVARRPNFDAMIDTLAETASQHTDLVGHESRSSTMAAKPGKGRQTEAAEGETPVTSNEAAQAIETVEAGVAEAPLEPATSVEAHDAALAEAVAEAVAPVDHADATHAPDVPLEPEIAAEPVVPAEPAPTASFAERAPAPVAAPAKSGGSGLGTALIAAVIGGAIGVGGSYGLATKGLMPNGGDARIAALEATISSLHAKATAPAAPTVDTGVAAKLEALDKRVGEITTAKPDLSGLEGRVAALEAAKPAATDLSGLEGRLAKLEANPVVSVPADLGERLAGLEAAAKARVEAAQTSVAGALSAVPSDGAAKDALSAVAGKVDQALAGLRESAGSEIATLKSRLDKLGSLEAEGKALADRVGALAATTGAELKKQNDEFAKGLADKVGAVAATTREELAKRNDEVTKALDGLRQRLAATEGLRAELDAALGRLGALETATRDAGSTGEKLAAQAGQAAAQAESKVGAIESRLAGVEAGAQAARKAQADAVVAVALAELKSAVDAGRPFKGELDVVKAAAPKGALDFAALEPFVAKGVPSVTGLRESWPKALRAMNDAEDKRTGGDGVFDRLWSHASGVVRVRPAGEKAGDDLSALASRVEARLVAGDLAGALVAWKGLPEGARKASADWGAALEARVSVDLALAAQTAAVVSKLTQQSQ